MDTAVRRVNSVDTNHSVALKYHTYTVVTRLIFSRKFAVQNINMGDW